MSIQPFIRGYGRSGHAVHEALLILSILEPEFRIRPPVLLSRADPIRPSGNSDHSVLFVSNPPGLHAQTLVAAAASGFTAMACEKPLCISVAEIELLRKIKQPVAVFHVYRQMWGPQMLQRMVSEGVFGEIVSIEGRYWQSSTAARSLVPSEARPLTWKNERELSGPSDTLLDVGSHWIDLAAFLAGESPRRFACTFSYAGAEREHRDSHAWVTMEFPKGMRAVASFSKNVHGATNHFEINVLGSKKSATWTFLRPDELFIGQGQTRSVLIRQKNSAGTRHPAFHGAGWLEGYVEIARLHFLHLLGRSHDPYPDMQQSLDVLQKIFPEIRN